MGSNVIEPPKESVMRDIRWPDLATATVYNPDGLEVVAPVTDLAGETTITIDASVAGVYTLAVPIEDPDGVVVNGWHKAGGLRTSPFLSLCIPMANAPTAGSGVSVLIGILDGSAPASDQWSAGGSDYSDVVGPRPRVAAHNIAASSGLVSVPGGIFASYELATSPSTTAQGIFFLVGRAVVAPTDAGGSGNGRRIDTVATFTQPPSMIVQITSPGTSGDSAMEFRFSAGHQTLFVQAA